MKEVTLPDYLVRTALQYFEGLGTPSALSAALALRYGLWDRVAEVHIDPRSFLNADAYLRSSAPWNLLKKLKELPSGIDKVAAAKRKWWEGERQCYATNERLGRYLRENSSFSDRDDRISAVLAGIRKIILSWLGKRPPSFPDGRFGPGSTFSDRGDRITVPDKMTSDPTLTRDAVWYLPQWLGTQWGASLASRHGELDFVRGNRYTTVPKTAKTDRSIAIEPSINLFYQLGMGKQLRTKLQRVGWDLDTAQDVHRQVAETSSVSREFATLDLSNASDTVARNLVKLLLPHPWFDALDDLRSKRTYIDGHWVMLEKFSSMGNGFTFELETIIFAAISCYVSQQCGHMGILGMDVFVFGDDIIVKNDVARTLVAVLRFLGFSLNEEKSYLDESPFRESCGGDYFAGKPVRSYYLKELPNEPQDFIAFANGVSAVNERIALAGGPTSRRAWFSILDRIPTGVRLCRGPKDLGDLVIHDQEERWTFRYRRSIRYFRAYRPARYRKVRYEWYSPEVVLACATYGTGNSPGGCYPGTQRVREGYLIPRDGLLSYKVSWVPLS